MYMLYINIQVCKRVKYVRMYVRTYTNFFQEVPYMCKSIMAIQWHMHVFCILVPITHLVIPYSFAPGMSGYLGRPPTATTTRAAVMVSSFPRRFTCWQRREVNVKHIVEGVVKAHAVAMILSVDAFSSKFYRK